MRKLTTLALITLCALAPARANVAQKPSKDACPWCREDPELMKKAGVLSHGPIPIGKKQSPEIAAWLPASQWVFLETAHLRWASSLPAINLDLEEQARIAPELARLRAVLPDVPVKVKKLDPWLRLHLYAMKGEEFYARFQKLLQVTDDDFPLERRIDEPYMGAGKFLGEKDKFEVVLHTSRGTHHEFTRDFSGTQVTGALRWHFEGVHKMLVSIPCEDSDLKRDRWLFPHVVHNLSHLFFMAYKHFYYDPPMWLDEGIALAMEKEIDPRATTNEGEEGTFNDASWPADWADSVRKMLQRGKQVGIAELMRVNEVGELSREGSFTVWSIARFLIDEHPDRLAKFMGGVKGQLDEKGQQTGRDLPGLQRQLLRDLWGWTPQMLDEQWKSWASRTTAPKDEKAEKDAKDDKVPNDAR